MHINKLAMIWVLGAVAVGSAIALKGNSTTSEESLRLSRFGIERKGEFTGIHGVDWYNNYQDALVTASTEDKPVLLLSMFGRLDEPIACANARTLRATLFKDPDFQKFITNEAVPAWEMVREVPKITIDLGDGKPIHRTVRGNAVIYLCNSKGQVLDVFPGVYTAEHIMPELRESWKALKGATPEEIAKYHLTKRQNPREIGPPRGLARTITTGKMAVESPALGLIDSDLITQINLAPGNVKGRDDRRYREFLMQSRRLVDSSLSTGTALSLSDVIGVEIPRDATPAEIGQLLVETDSGRNMSWVRATVHNWFMSLTEHVTPLEAREDILWNMLKIPYKDPSFGIKEVLLPGTPEDL